jgi:hypothetical protein
MHHLCMAPDLIRKSETNDNKGIIFPINSDEPIPIDNHLFKGTATLVLRPLQSEHDPQFHQRLPLFLEQCRDDTPSFYFLLQGKFKRPLQKDALLVGGELLDPCIIDHTLSSFTRRWDDLLLRLLSRNIGGSMSGFRDVTKRMLTMTPQSDTWIAIAGALVGDVVSLCFHTPADALALRLQAQNETVGDRLGDSLARLPMVLATDLPCLLSKVVLNRWFIHGHVPVDQYAELAVLTAIIAALLTTPFDVARTRIVVDKKFAVQDDSDDRKEQRHKEEKEKEEKEMIWDVHVDKDLPQVGREGGEEKSNTPSIATTRPGYSVIQTMKQITKEGDGGLANLFAGWLERVLYLGIGRDWLEPVQLIGYIGIRDAVLMEWF